MLFRSMLFNLQMFWDFPAIFLLLISRFISFWSENNYFVISLLLNLVRPSFVLWSVLANVPCELEKNMQLLDEVACRCQLHPVDWWCCWIQLCPDFLPAGSIHYWWRVLKPPTVIVNSSVQFYQLLPHIVWCPVVRHIHIKDSYVLLE